MKYLLFFFFCIILTVCQNSSVQAHSTSNYYNTTTLSTQKLVKREVKVKKGLGERRKVIALLLCLLLGWFAVHRWYLGISDRSRFLFSLIYFVLSLFFYIHILLDFICILFGKMDFYLDNPGIFIWVMIFFK